MSNLEFITVEQSFQVPILHPETGEPIDWGFFAGRWDGLVRRKDNGWLFNWELKTARSPEQRISTLDNDLQCSYYQLIGRDVFGEDFKGSIYTILGKRAPTIPDVNSTGYLSKNIKSQTFDSYMTAIRRHHPHWTNEEISEQYGDALIALYELEAAGKNSFFQRRVVMRNPAALQYARQHLYDVAYDMLHGPRIYYHPGTHCNYCLVKDPCIALQNNTGAQYILESEYHQRSRASDSVPVPEVPA
jgi:hypothetical protein